MEIVISNALASPGWRMRPQLGARRPFGGVGVGVAAAPTRPLSLLRCCCRLPCQRARCANPAGAAGRNGLLGPGRRHAGVLRAPRAVQPPSSHRLLDDDDDHESAAAFDSDDADDGAVAGAAGATGSTSSSSLAAAAATTRAGAGASSASVSGNGNGSASAATAAAAKPPATTAAAVAAAADADDAGGAARYAYAPANVFEALPPPANVGRRRQVAALVGAAMVEFTLSGARAFGPLSACLSLLGFLQGLALLLGDAACVCVCVRLRLGKSLVLRDSEIDMQQPKNDPPLPLKAACSGRRSPPPRSRSSRRRAAASSRAVRPPSPPPPPSARASSCSRASPSRRPRARSGSSA